MGGRNGHVKTEESGVLQCHLDGLMADGPVVVVLPCDDDTVNGFPGVGANDGCKEHSNRHKKVFHRIHSTVFLVMMVKLLFVSPIVSCHGRIP